MIKFIMCIGKMVTASYITAKVGRGVCLMLATTDKRSVKTKTHDLEDTVVDPCPIAMAARR